MVPKPPMNKRWRAPCISDGKWHVINAKVSIRREPTWYKKRTRTLGQQIRDFLNMERRQWAAETVTAVESLITSDSPLAKEAWRQIWGWYKYAMNPTPPTTPYHHCTDYQVEGCNIQAVAPTRR